MMQHGSTRARRGLGVLALVVLLAGVLLVAGFSASYQVSSARRGMERIEARNLRELAAGSAFEEVCARLSAGFARADPLTEGEQRNLGAVVTWPGTSTPLTSVHTVEPAASRVAYKSAGVTFAGPVSVVSGPWERAVKDSEGTQFVQELGIARLTAVVKVAIGGYATSHQVTALRYFFARPVDGQLELAIGSKNLALEVVEKP
jgi:hypothetical protein